MKKVFRKLFLLSFATFFVAGFYACQKDVPTAPLDETLRKDPLFKEVMDLNVEVTRPTVRKIVAMHDKNAIRRYALDAQLIKKELEVNPTELNGEFAAQFLGFESLKAYETARKPLNEKLAELHNKYPQLAKMTDEERFDLFDKVMKGDEGFINMVNEEIARGGGSCLAKDLCKTVVEIAALVGKGYLCTPLGFPLGTLCSLGLDLAKAALLGLCDLIPC
ncbi:MAG: hypothetical protein K1X55_03615 [Chitinophagales bacterium]|nr:hypothetical protein [Chitinophagales bacterium]